MKYHSRELLVTTRVAQQWQDDFEKQVNILMEMIGKIDNEAILQHTTELMNVYQHTAIDTAKKNKTFKAQAEKPFEFLAFKN